MDGQIIIGTGLDTKQLEKQLKDEEKQLQQFEKEAEKLTTTKAKLEMDIKPFEDAKKEAEKQMEELEGQFFRAKQNLKELQSQVGTPEFESMRFQDRQDVLSDIRGYKEQIEEIPKEIDRINASLNETPPKIQQQIDKLEQVNKELEQNATNQTIIRDRISQTNAELGKAKGFQSIKDALKNVGKETEKNVKKVGRWALAIFGIRSIYLGLRQAINTISAGDEQLASDIKYIKDALAYALEPIVRKIVEWAKQLMFYIGYIVKAWTGKNIFENANKGLKGANKEAKELKKQLAGIDEANVLSDSSSKKDSTTAPSFDLSKTLDDTQVPSWLDWIVKHKDEILAVLGGIGTALLLIKFGCSGIMATGIGLMVTGIILAVQNLLDYLKDPTWENFGGIVQGIGIFVIGLGVAFLGLPVIIAGVGVLILGTIMKYWDDIKKFLQSGIDWFRGIGDWLRQNVGENAGALWDIVCDQLQAVLDFFDNTFSAIRKIFDGVIDFVAGIFTGDWNRVWEGVKKIFGGIWDWMVGHVKLIFTTVSNLIQGAVRGILTIFEGLWTGVKFIFEKIGNLISKLPETLQNIFKGAVNIVIGILNFFVKAINKIGFDVPDWVPVIGGKRWGFNLPEIPKLAQGGIVDTPNRGVMMGNYVAGESGKEAVLPLTNPNTMAMLGQEIARYVNINNAVDVYMDSRRINRIMQQSQSASDFARNV